MKTNEENQTDKGLEQNAAFIRDAYRKAVITGMLSILSVNINVFVDGILVGRAIGSEALAAINLSLPVYWTLCVIGSFLAAGTEIPAAHAIGAGDTRMRDAYFRTGLNVSLLASALVTVVSLVFLNPLVSFLCSDAAAWEYVRQYVMITMIGALPKIVIYIPFWYLCLDGKNTDVSLMMVGMAVINIVLDVLFVNMFKMGVFGAGLASVIATATACIYGIIRLFVGKSPYTWSPEILRGRTEWFTISAAGFPSAFNNLCATVRLLIVNAMLMAAGGAGLVAVFTAINGIWGFGECITLGVPAAGGSMLGVFNGEKDNGSCRLLLWEEWRIGSLAGVVFLVLCAVLSGWIPRMYGLEGSLLVPLLWMALAVFPALFLGIFMTFYNMSGQNARANAIIFFRGIVLPFLSLLLALIPALSAILTPFSFLLFAELGTVLLWWAGTWLHHWRHPGHSRWLLTDLDDEKSGRVLNFSVSAELYDIVSASERISGFCAKNGLNPGETIRLEMSMEEVMTLIRQVNEEAGNRSLRFDLRAYSVRNMRGIRIRYSGIPFNPFLFSSREAEEDMYMGVRMIKKMVELVNYQSAFGVNTLQIILKEEKANEA